MTRRRGFGAAGQGGVTLLELLVAMVIAAVIGIAITTLWRQSTLVYIEGAAAADAQQQLRVGLDHMVRMIQAAGSNPTNARYAGPVAPAAPDPAFVAFREAGRRCFRLYADLNGDGDVADPEENVLFNWSGTAGNALTLTEGGGPDAGQPWVAPVGTAQELTEGVVANPSGAPIFQYITGREDGTPDTLLAFGGGACGGVLSAANAARIGRVVVTLSGRRTVTAQPLIRTLTTEARPRNIP